MKVDIYPSAKKSGKFLGVPAGTDLSTWQPPQDFDPDLTEVRPLHSTHNLSPSDKRAGMDAAKVIADINNDGYAVIGVSVSIEVGQKRV